MAQGRTDISREEAEYLAIRALAFLAEDSGRLDRFMALTGITADRLKRDAGEPAVLTAILDHLLGDEPLLLAFAANNGADPAQVARARGVLERERDPGAP